MAHIYEIYIPHTDEALSVLFSEFYYILAIIIDYTIGYCPFFYQLIYFYVPLVYFIRRRRAKKNNFEGFFDDSVFNWLYLQILSILKMIPKPLVLFEYIKTKVITFFAYIKVICKYAIKPLFKEFISWLKARNFLTWRPVFKKYSYFGIFSYIRSKWFKNK
jgi:hypothetical protein